jgi:hypothetical protein
MPYILQLIPWKSNSENRGYVDFGKGSSREICEGFDGDGKIAGPLHIILFNRDSIEINATVKSGADLNHGILAFPPIATTNVICSCAF